MASSTALSLYEIEDSLQALLDTEALVKDDASGLYLEALEEQLRTAIDKRQRFGEFIMACEAGAKARREEAERLLDSAAKWDFAGKRARSIVGHVIESLPLDAKGKHRKLEAHTFTFSLAVNPSKVVGDGDEPEPDPAKVPAEFKDVTVKLPAHVWEAHLLRYQELRSLLAPPDPGTPTVLTSANVTYSVRKADVKKAIEAGVEVPGADVRLGGNRLVIK